MSNKRNYVLEYTKRNKEKKKAYDKIYRQVNKEKLREKRRKYHLEHLQHELAYFKKYRKEHRTKCMERTEAKRQEYKKLWLNWLTEIGFTRCSLCGYDHCFDAIHFHHKNPKEKEAKICQILQLPITPERKEEIRKTIPLCANCHAETHYNIRNA